MVSMSPTHKKTYRAILISILLILMIPLSFLIFMGSVAIHKENAITPYDFPGSVWESQEPFIHLEVSEDIGDGINGTIQINGETKEVEMELKTVIGSFAEIYDKDLIAQKQAQQDMFFDDYILLKAYCKYSENTIVMKIDEDNLYGGKYKKIVLDRVD